MADTTKIQWSIFTPNQKEQYVIRVDTWEEFVELKKNVLQDIPKTNAFPDDIGSPTATPVSNTQEVGPTCDIHHVTMSWKPPGISKAGRPYPGFFSCPTRMPDGSFCRLQPQPKV